MVIRSYWRGVSRSRPAAACSRVDSLSPRSRAFRAQVGVRADQREAVVAGRVGDHRDHRRVQLGDRRERGAASHAGGGDPRRLPRTRRRSARRTRRGRAGRRRAPPSHGAGPYAVVSASRAGAATVIEGCAIATIDDERRELADGHIVIRRRPDRHRGRRARAAQTSRPPRPHRRPRQARHARARQLPPPSLPVGHARPRAAVDAVRVARRALPGVAAHRRGDRGRRGPRRPGRSSRARAARRRPTTTTSSRRAAGDLLEVEIGAARAIGLRFHPCRGAMDLGRSAGGLPPDDVVEDRDAILAASAEAIDRFHDPAPGAMVRIALAPTSPFSVTGELMRETAELARARGVRLHTHLAETDDEEVVLPRALRRAAARVRRVARLARRRRLARPLRAPGRGRGGEDGRDGHRRRALPHVQRPARRRDRTRSRAAARGHPGRARRRRRGLERVRRAVDELRAALVLARVAHGPAALTARDALELATRHGARCLGREDELGHLTRARSPTSRSGTSTSPASPARRPGLRARLRPHAPGPHAAGRWPRRVAAASCDRRPGHPRRRPRPREREARAVTYARRKELVIE